MLNPKLSLNINDKNVLSKYIAAELDLYNAYVESLTAAVNRKPDNFYDITLEQSHLFSELCVAGISIDEAKKDQRFQNSKEILNSIPESVKIIFEIAKIKSQTLNFTKKNMSLAQIGKKHKPETKLKISEANNVPEFRRTIYNQLK